MPSKSTDSKFSSHLSSAITAIRVLIPQQDISVRVIPPRGDREEVRIRSIKAFVTGVPDSPVMPIELGVSDVITSVQGGCYTLSSRVFVVGQYNNLMTTRLRYPEHTIPLRPLTPAEIVLIRPVPTDMSDFENIKPLKALSPDTDVDQELGSSA